MEHAKANVPWTWESLPSIRDHPFDNQSPGAAMRACADELTWTEASKSKLEHHRTALRRELRECDELIQLLDEQIKQGSAGDNWHDGQNKVQGLARERSEANAKYNELFAVLEKLEIDTAEEQKTMQRLKACMQFLNFCLQPYKRLGLEDGDTL